MFINLLSEKKKRERECDNMKVTHNKNKHEMKPSE